MKASLEPPLEERLVVDREIEREGRGRNGEDRQEYPSLPVIPRAGRPEDERDEEDQAEHALQEGLPVQRVHSTTLAEDARSAARARQIAGRPGGEPDVGKHLRDVGIP